MSEKAADSNVTRLLFAWSQGDETALTQLMPLIVEDLRRVAARHLAQESPGHTLQPTALVNELYLRLRGRRQVSWKNRTQFFACVAGLMRQLSEEARVEG